MLHGGARREEQAIQVRAERPIEFGGFELGKTVAVALVSGVQDQDVDPAELGYRVGDDLLGEPLVANVTAERGSADARVANERDCLLGVLVFFRQRRDGDIRALTGEGDRDRPTDSRVAAGDQRPPPGESAVPHIRILAIVRRRSHRSLEPRLLLFLLGEIVGGVCGPRILGCVVRSHAATIKRTPAGPRGT